MSRPVFFFYLSLRKSKVRTRIWNFLAWSDPENLPVSDLFGIKVGTLLAILYLEVVKIFLENITLTEKYTKSCCRPIIIHSVVG
jgi:hypothetical protein